jgi:hypothetical protein
VVEKIIKPVASAAGFYFAGGETRLSAVELLRMNWQVVKPIVIFFPDQ